MSIQTTKPFLDEHSELRGHVEHLPIAARELPKLTIEERVDVIERIVAFLGEVLLPHAVLEQRLLYPGAARLLDEPDGSDSVSDDRLAVRELLQALGDADVRDTGALQELVFGLYLLLNTHLQKEEELYMKLLGSKRDERVRELLIRVARGTAPNGAA